ncbi:MAG: 3-deoxy-7-phosphoheptulonate synthase [Planctomycetes bacterium]|nr:3-deoxy-7-phosphoheptulonate synthase [Planctomycetota bacterium]
MLITSKEEPVQALIQPGLLEAEQPISETAAETVRASRKEVIASLHGSSDKLLVICGPCSIHDIHAAQDYAALLYEEAQQYSQHLHVVMRVYFEKPRTNTGWKGLINDPNLDNSFQINKGLRIARKLLIDINEMGLGCGCSLLDTISPQYIFDLVTWCAVGAGSTESQNHRQLCSGVSPAVGFKNGTDGNMQVAVDAIGAAKHPHCFLGVTKEGLSAIVTTNGNPDCHLILRGSQQGCNYDSESIADAIALLEKNASQSRLMVDCGNGNCAHNDALIGDSVSTVAQQIANGNKNIFAVMIESNLIAGRQLIGESMKFGQSITEGCVSWNETQTMLQLLATAVESRRKYT